MFDSVQSWEWVENEPRGDEHTFSRSMRGRERTGGQFEPREYEGLPSSTASASPHFASPRTGDNICARKDCDLHIAPGEHCTCGYVYGYECPHLTGGECACPAQYIDWDSYYARMEENNG
jgi:hypothetical protein